MVAAVMAEIVVTEVEVAVAEVAVVAEMWDGAALEVGRSSTDNG